MLFLSRSAYRYIVSADSISSEIHLLSCIYYSLVETSEKLLPPAQFLLRFCCIDESLKRLVISRHCELGSSQLSFKDLERIDYC